MYSAIIVCWRGCSDEAAYDRLLEGAKAEFVFTDPPYNVVVIGKSAASAGFVIASLRWAPAT